MNVQLVEVIRVANIEAVRDRSDGPPAPRLVVDAVPVEPSAQIAAFEPAPAPASSHPVAMDLVDLGLAGPDDAPVTPYRARQAMRAYGRTLARRAQDRR